MLVTICGLKKRDSLQKKIILKIQLQNGTNILKNKCCHHLSYVICIILKDATWKRKQILNHRKLAKVVHIHLNYSLIHLQFLRWNNNSIRLIKMDPATIMHWIILKFDISKNWFSYSTNFNIWIFSIVYWTKQNWKNNYIQEVFNKRYIGNGSSLKSFVQKFLISNFFFLNVFW